MTFTNPNMPIVNPAWRGASEILFRFFLRNACWQCIYIWRFWHFWKRNLFSNSSVAIVASSWILTEKLHVEPIDSWGSLVSSDLLKSYTLKRKHLLAFIHAYIIRFFQALCLSAAARLLVILCRTEKKLLV